MIFASEVFTILRPTSDGSLTCFIHLFNSSDYLSVVLG